MNQHSTFWLRYQFSEDNVWCVCVCVWSGCLCDLDVHTEMPSFLLLCVSDAITTLVYSLDCFVMNT